MKKSVHWTDKDIEKLKELAPNCSTPADLYRTDYVRSRGFSESRFYKAIANHGIKCGGNVKFEGAPRDFEKPSHSEWDALPLDVRRSLLKMTKNFSPKEIKLVSEGGRIIPGQHKIPMIDFSGVRIRFGFITDTHFGSIFTMQEHYETAIKEMKKERCEFIVHGGDITEGYLTKRTGHVFELSHIGYDLQMDYSVEMMKLWPKKWLVLGGNHDEWVKQDAGADIAKAICEKLKGAEYLGMIEGTFSLKNVSVDVFHGGRMKAYAYSYHGQKKAESFTGGEKPNILLLGHVHKYYSIFPRHVWAVCGGSIQLQSAFMKRHNIEAHPGFAICDAWINKSGLSKFTHTFYPFYG